MSLQEIQQQTNIIPRANIIRSIQISIIKLTRRKTHNRIRQTQRHAIITNNILTTRHAPRPIKSQLRRPPSTNLTNTQTPLMSRDAESMINITITPQGQLPITFAILTLRLPTFTVRKIQVLTSNRTTRILHSEIDNLIGKFDDQIVIKTINLPPHLL